MQSFKKALRKSKEAPLSALQEFLMMYRRTPTATGFSPSELLNGRQIRTRIDALAPSTAQFAQIQQKRQTKTIEARTFEVGDYVYARCFQPVTSTATERWTEAVVVKKGSRNYTVKVRGKLRSGVLPHHFGLAIQ